MWPDTRLRDLFSIDHPIIQAPMAGASGLDMALAVSAAGGLGSLACAALDPDRLHGVLATAREKTAKSLNVNFFAHAAPKDDPARDAAWLGKLSAYHAELGLDAPDALSVGPLRPFDAARCAVIGLRASRGQLSLRPARTRACCSGQSRRLQDYLFGHNTGRGAMAGCAWLRRDHRPRL